MHGRKAFTLLEVLIVALIIGILLMIAIPHFITARASSRQKTCKSNLRQMNSAKEQFAMENNRSNGDPAESYELAPNYIKAMPKCPGGGTYTIGAIGSNARCSLESGSHAHKL